MQFGSDRQMMATKTQQIQNGFLYVLPVLMGNLLPFITIPIFSRILTPEDYGVLGLATIYAILVNGVANFGMTAAYERNYFQFRDSRLQTAQLLYSILLFVLLNFFLLAGMTYLFRGALSRLIIGSAEHGDILFWTTCAQFFSGITYYHLAYFKNTETAKDFVVYTIVTSLINVVLSLFLVAYLRTGIIGLVYAQLCSGVIVFSALSYRFLSLLPFALNRAILVESLRLAYPLTPRIFLGVIGTQFDKYMVGLLDSVGGAGIYNIGQKISYLVFTYMTAIQNVFSPQVYQRMFDLGKQGGIAIGRFLTPFAYISTCLALVIALFSEEVIAILTPPAYHGAIDIVAILSMYYGILFIGKITGPQLIFAKKTHITSLLTVVSIIVNIGVNIPIIMTWGAVGAAWGTFLVGVITNGISFFVAQHYYEIRWEYLRMGAIFLTLFVFTIVLILLRGAGVDYYLRMPVKLLALCIYGYIGVKIGVIASENLVLVRNLVASCLRT